MLRAIPRISVLLFIFINLSAKTFAQASCAGASTLTPGSTCVAVLGNLKSATGATPAPVCGSGTAYSVWYKFTATSSTTSVTINNFGSGLTGGFIPYLQIFSGTCGSLTSLNCVQATSGSASIIQTGLIATTVYYVRVYTIIQGTGNPATQWDFNICIQNPPANDDCSGAVTLSNAVTNSSGSVWLATASSGIPVACASGDPDDDVWYKFIPSGIYLNVSLSAIGINLNSSGTRLQLFSGTCGSLTSVACGTTSITDTVTNGATYYIRVYSAGTGSIGGTAPGSAFSITAIATAQVTVISGRMKEVYEQTILSPANALADPWEITYGPDNYLWITEAKGYKAYRMDPVTGSKTTILDISQGSTFFSSPADQAFNAQFNIGTNNPQGGFAGLALHPKFMDAITPMNYVYISYVHTFIGGSSPTGIFYTNRLVRFTYNTGTGKLESPVSLCDTLPGSNDHNSQRIIIAPVGGTNYLFYGQGDMGAGQFSNKDRINKAQNPASYEGKILRFNLVTDGDAGLAAWIPNDNPYSSTSAVWSIGIRNNQGFAYDTATGILYGSSHGPYSDDEINIIEQSKNYGHPLVIGYAADNNYNGSTAGASNTTSSCPLIVSESGNAATIGASYKDPLFSAYAASQAVVNNIWLTNPSNGGWPSEGWSGLDIYKNTFVPGWKNSLVVSSLKWGRVLRMKLGPSGTTIVPTNGSDTISYFGSQNRFRDIAFAPNGKDMYVVMDRSTTSSGPSSGNPIVPSCAGCVQKYTFLGYADAAGKSTIPTAIDVTDGTINTCNTGTMVTIDNTNNNLWVPITGSDGNIMAEIYPNGNNLGIVTSSFYKNSGSIRIKNGTHYLDRNITITPQNQPSTSVKIRLYISKVEFDALDADPVSGISAITDLKILKNTDPCSSSVVANTTLITPTFAEAHGSNGYMLQGNISAFSSFYFSSSNIALPLDLLTFSGSLQNNSTVLLKWKTENEINISHFQVERSIDGNHYNAIGTISSNGNNITGSVFNYSFTDIDAANQQSLLLYYRLKVVDRDGSFKYSGIITISLADITGKMTVSPNPAISEVKVNISAPAEGRILWKLIDNTGRVVLQNSENVRKGYGNNFTINISKLSRGSYYLSVSGANIDQKIKLQKL